MSLPTIHPCDEWVLQQARNATMWLDDIGVKATGLIRDRDTKFTTRFDVIWKSEGAKVHKTPVRSPMANSFAECYIGKIKSEYLNLFYCFSLDHLDYINREWLKYYHNQRPHQGIDINNNVLDVDFKPTDQGEVKREQRLAESFRGTTATLRSSLNTIIRKSPLPVQTERRIHRALIA
ncbi:hypothetical protein PDESU_02604 [Pontiella desulfatans]|uniref:Integrase catalytic domain-containing protein n=1 Tax=Pontiella desulfatans TaxID=2750659 RepID=A0A6C2U2E8_PONDE|nr:transposase [Pontiella desulfatans]VGO14047.1 hypothetical protein PDESU_02604 [Pontiella desulfatans]